MNDFARKNATENDFPAMKNLGKGVLGLPAMRSKGRALENVENICKPLAAVHLNKEAAAARQRANAEKLSKGYSVDGRFGKDKENTKEAGKCTVKAPTRGFGRDRPNSTTLGLEKSPFRVPNKPAKQIKKTSTTYNIQKSESVTSLHGPAQDIKPESKPIATVVPFIFDDDKKYVKDEMLLGIYAKDIYNYLKRLEREQSVRCSYLTSHHIMTDNMRSVLVDWMYEVQQSFNLLVDTAQMAVALLDRFLQDTPRVPKEDLQLVGVSCIFIASKYEEMYPPAISDLVTVSADACSKRQILRMEQRIFKTLGFSIARPTPVQFLRRYCRQSQVNTLTYTVSKYFVDLALVQYAFCHVPPSLLAAAALFMALYVKPDSPSLDELWTPAHVFYTEYTNKEIKPILPMFAKLLLQVPKMKQRCVQQMYSTQKKHKDVTTLPELTSEKIILLSKLV